MRARHASVVIWVSASRTGTEALTGRAAGRDVVVGIVMAAVMIWLASDSETGVLLVWPVRAKNTSSRLGCSTVALVISSWWFRRAMRTSAAWLASLSWTLNPDPDGERIGVTRVSSAASATAFAVSTPSAIWTRRLDVPIWVLS